MPDDSYPILEFDPDPTAVIEPSAHFGTAGQGEVDMPATVVACFFGDVVERVASAKNARQVVQLTAEHGRHAIWAMEHRGREVAFYQPGLGAPLSAGFLEEAIDYGARTVVAVGGCGALSPEMGLGHVIVVSAALRDEGTSYHYLPPSRIVDADAAPVALMEDLLRERGVPFTTGMTWTTDAPYRETRAKVQKRREEGCVTVEMEAAALIAVARFRGVTFGQMLYAGDSLAGDDWDHRGWMFAHDVREEMFWLAADSAARLGR